jgi:hypothetical protein
MDMVNVLFVKPGNKHFKPLLVVGENLVLQFSVDEECHIKLLFGNIHQVCILTYGSS